MSRAVDWAVEQLQGKVTYIPRFVRDNWPRIASMMEGRELEELAQPGPYIVRPEELPEPEIRAQWEFSQNLLRLIAAKPRLPVAKHGENEQLEKRARRARNDELFNEATREALLEFWFNKPQLHQLVWKGFFVPEDPENHGKPCRGAYGRDILDINPDAAISCESAMWDIKRNAQLDRKLREGVKEVGRTWKMLDECGLPNPLADLRNYLKALTERAGASKHHP